MPFRGGPRTVDEHIADIEEQLRKLDRRPRTVTITTPPAPTPSAGISHTHDDPGYSESTVVGGLAEEVTPAKARAGKYGVGIGDWARAGWNAVAIGWQAIAGDPDADGYKSIAIGYRTVAEGDESVVLGDDALEEGINQSSFNVLIGARSELGNETWGAINTIVIGPSNYVHAQDCIVLGNTIFLGDRTNDTSVVYHSVVIDPLGSTVVNPNVDGADHLVLIGPNIFITQPPVGDVSALPYPDGIVMLQGSRLNQVWGEDLLVLSSGGNSGAQASVWGTGLITVGPNVIERYSGFFEVWENIIDAAAFGYNNRVSGDYSMVIGQNGTTYRTEHMVLYTDDGGAITLGNIIEIANAQLRPSAGVIHSGNMGSLNGTVCPVHCNMPGSYGPVGGTVQFILDDVDADALHVYSRGTDPNGDDFLNGSAIGTWFIIKKVDDSANTVTVIPESGTIDGHASIVLTDQWDYVEVVAINAIDGAGGAVATWTLIAGMIGGIPIGSSSAILQSPPFQKTGTLTAIVTGTSPWYPEIDGVIESVRAAVGTGPSAGNVICDVHKNGATIFTTAVNRPTITVGNVTDVSPAPDDPDFIGGTDYFTVDIDDPGTDAADLVVTIRYRAA